MTTRFQRLQELHVGAHVQGVRERRGMADELNHLVEVCGALRSPASQNHGSPELWSPEDQIPPSAADMREPDVVPTGGRYSCKDVDEKLRGQFGMDGCGGVVDGG